MSILEVQACHSPVKVEAALNRTDAMLVVIGPTWLQSLNERINDSRDWVRFEVAHALKRSYLPVVPICSAGVAFPQRHELPEDLKDLGWRDGIILDPFQDFDSHLNRFLTDLERVLEELKESKAALHMVREQLVTLLNTATLMLKARLMNVVQFRIQQLQRETRR
jgi:hypothetical protein